MKTTGIIWNIMLALMTVFICTEALQPPIGLIPPGHVPTRPSIYAIYKLKERLHDLLKQRRERLHDLLKQRMNH
ncbi:unnamed protein product [Cylicocyclus nassatus]|uniref:Uncharacterized protein n=1 Tax=Cylicocyclus nassatus TaxID=53992 RepID=A0AA36GWG4_CYLNA|nr:unnamed protein product [Cylicocyclus nassatus]